MENVLSCIINLTVYISMAMLYVSHYICLYGYALCISLYMSLWLWGFEMTCVVSQSLTGLLPPELSFSWLYTLLKLSRLEAFNLTNIN